MGPAQLGAMAALVVLFVPLGLAGWHLSRHKMLFFSGALFISLAVGVHLAPFFPSATRLFLSSPNLPHLDPLSCLPFIHDISFTETSSSRSWSWPRSGPAASCGLQSLSASDAADLLNGSWILVAGDSQARLLALALLRLVLDPPSVNTAESDLFRRHSDYQILVAEHGIRLDFIWAPYETNLTHSVLHQLATGRNYPDVLVMGTGLWHMLHVSNATDYEASLMAVRGSADSIQQQPISPPEFDAPRRSHMFWLGLPTLVNSMLNTNEKRERMNSTMWGAYNQGADNSKILRRSGGPLFLLDIGLLSRNCGHNCTEDGMHYDRVVYEAALHIMFNALLIESQQRIDPGN